MRRIPKYLLLASLALVGVAGFGAPALAADAADAPGVVRAGVDDFSFASYAADYYLDVDAAGRSTLKTVETFVATFPESDQNHGMKRAIPDSYQGIPTDITVEGVTDGEGKPRPFTTESDNGFLVVTSRADGFVHGDQTYVFTYTQHDITRYFPDTDDDELYWDTVGTGWAQPFGAVTAHFHVPAGLVKSLNGSTACYRGGEGATDRCEVTPEPEGTGTVFTVSAEQLAPYENVTVAIGFKPHTFTPRDDSFFASPFGVLQLLSVIAALAALVWSIVLRVTTFADGKGRPTVIAEYTPPKGLDIVTAAVILGRTTRAAAAEFIDLAVTRKVRIVETEKPGFFSRGKAYLLELIDASGLDGSALAFATALFGYPLAPGTGYLMSGKDVALSQQVRAIILAATRDATATGLRKKPRSAIALLVAAIAVLGGIGTAWSGFSLINDSRGGLLPFLLFFPAAIAVFVVFKLVFRPALSDRGAELRDHLKGLELYIRLAEADRLRMLQSPTGAEREAVSATDPRQVVDVYEKLLPYAVLFNLEREWAAELAKYYTEQSPDWYAGSGAFNAAVFASSIGSLSSTAASSYSGSASSSSSGGAGGGGSSGGGGGGGGGGGV
ncbi:DUF2207 domain-containing protein [soil metagenome]